MTAAKNATKPAGPDITRRASDGRYFIGNVPPTFANADDAMRYHADIVRIVGRLELEAEIAAEKKAKP
jgi:hypothetical protein